MEKIHELELTAEEVSRYIAGIEASVDAMTEMLTSDITLDEKKDIFQKNLRFIKTATLNESIRDAVPDLVALQASINAAAVVMRPIAPPTEIEILANHLEELGL